LAAATLELFDFACDARVVGSIYEAHRGRCYEDVLDFPRLLALVRDALLQHGGSGHRLFVELERGGREPVDESNFYRKLARTPVAVSRALLRECTARLAPLMDPQGPEAAELPGCFDRFEVAAIDGKKIKNAAKRLLPTRGYGGKLLAAKALVALDVRRGLALAMSDSLDGEANDVPLVPALLPQVRAVIPGGRSSGWRTGSSATRGRWASWRDARGITSRCGSAGAWFSGPNPRGSSPTRRAAPWPMRSACRAGAGTRRGCGGSRWRGRAGTTCNCSPTSWTRRRFPPGTSWRCTGDAGGSSRCSRR
jgi:hypothetical protein